MKNSGVTIGVLLFQALNQLLHYYGYVLILLIFAHIGKKSRYFSYSLPVIAGIGAIAFQLQFGSYYDLATEIILSTTLTLELIWLKLLSLSKIDYWYVFLTLLFPDRIFSSAISIFGDCLIFTVLIFVLPILIKTKKKKMEQYLLGISFAYCYLALTGYLLRLCVNLNFYNSTFSHLISRYLPLIIECIVSGIMLLITFILTRCFKLSLTRLKFVALQNKLIGYWNFYLTLITTVILLVCNLIILLVTRNLSTSLNRILPFFGIVILGIELAFVYLILNVSFYRKQISQMELAMNKRNTEQSLIELQKVRHDLKNLFFTMGTYINESQDSELKNYFWNKVYPFAENEISKSKVMQELCQIQSLPVRSLLQVKIMQIMNKRIDLVVDVKVKTTFMGIELIDLIRILGILLDNAIEESEKLEKAKISLIIKESDNGISYIIKNYVSTTFEMGQLTKGKTTKIGHQGLGLQIVNEVVNSYDNVTLNTFATNRELIQVLNIEK